MKTEKILSIVMALSMIVPVIFIFGTREVSGAGLALDWGHGVAVDAQDNIYVVGYGLSYSLAGSDGNRDVFVRKYDIAGNIKWTVTYDEVDWNGNHEQRGNSIAVDASYVYVVGTTCSQIPGNGYDIMVLKYDKTNGDLVDETIPPDGVPDWPIYYQGANNEYGLSISVIGNRLDVCGNSCGQNGKSDIIILSFTTTGAPSAWNPYIWGGANTDDQGLSVKSDVNNGIYVTGTSDWAGRGKDIIILKLNSATGILYDDNGDGLPDPPIWWWTNGADEGQSITVDNNNFYVAGFTNNQNGGDVVVLQYTKANRALTWSTFWGDQFFPDYGYGIAVDNTNIYVTGTTAGFGAAQGDVFILQYNKANHALWNPVPTWDSIHYTLSKGIALSSSNPALWVVVMGYTNQIVGGKFDAVSLRYYTTAPRHWDLNWEKYIGNSLTDKGNAIIVSGAPPCMYVAGSTESWGSANSADGFVAKFAANGVCAWWKSFDNKGIDSANAMAMFNNLLYITGSTEIWDAANGVWDACTIISCYNLNGVFQWSTTINECQNQVEAGNSIVLDDQYAYIAGYVGDPLAFQNTLFVDKISLQTHLPVGNQWPKWNLGSPVPAPPATFFPSTAAGITEDFDDYNAGGYLYVTGSFDKNWALNTDVFILAIYKSGAFEGQEVWAANPTWCNPFMDQEDASNAIALDGTDIYLAGWTVNQGSGRDVLVLKWDNTQVPPTLTWGFSNIFVAQDDGLFSMTIAGNPTKIYACGYANNGPGQGDDQLVLKFSTNGNLDAQNNIPSPHQDRAHSITECGGLLFVAGFSNEARYQASHSDDLVMETCTMDNLLTFGVGMYWG